MTDLVSCYILVKGRVQGVGFRIHTSHLAESLNLKGYVRNLDTGEVEIEAEGKKVIIAGFLDELRQGKMKNYISAFEVKWDDYRHKYDTFSISF